MLYERALAHGKARGCNNFSEIMRDMIRVLTLSVGNQEGQNNSPSKTNNEFKQPPGVGG